MSVPPSSTTAIAPGELFRLASAAALATTAFAPSSVSACFDLTADVAAGLGMACAGARVACVVAAAVMMRPTAKDLKNLIGFMLPLLLLGRLATEFVNRGVKCAVNRGVKPGNDASGQKVPAV